MTSTPEAMERKIRRLDHDMQSIYEMLSGIAGSQRRHDNRFEEIGSDVSRLKGDVTKLKGGLAAVDTKVDQILTLLQR